MPGADEEATDGSDAGVEPARRPRFPRDSVEFNRIVNLSDGVAAIALTLLVLALEVPTPPGGSASNADIGAVLDELSTPVFAFTLSFVIIANSWYGHHRFIAGLRGLDAAMVTWNFAYLFFLVLMPFASDLVGTYGSNPEAVAVYAALMACLYLIGPPGYELARRRGLLSERLPSAELRWSRISRLVPGACFAASIPLVLVAQDTAAAYWTWVAIWPLTTFAERRRRRLAHADGGSGDDGRHHGGF